MINEYNPLKADANLSVFERFMIIMGRDVTSCKSCNNIFNYVDDNTISQ